MSICYAYVIYFMSLFPSVVILTEYNGLSMLSCCLDTEDSYYLTDLQKWKRKKSGAKINRHWRFTINDFKCKMNKQSYQQRLESNWHTVCGVEACGGLWNIKQFLTWICCADHSPASFNRHPLLNLPAKAICLHKRPASKAMLVWLLNYWNCNSIIFLLVCTHTDKNTFSPTSTHRVWYPTVPVDEVYTKSNFTISPGDNDDAPSMPEGP